MAKYQLTQVGKRKIKLSNLEKVLFPDCGIIKAELLAYYLTMAPVILRYIRSRPLSLIRYPDGIESHQFFQKDKPDWAPDWIKSVPLGKEEQKHYLMADEDATLVWLANLACIELHIRQDKHPRHDRPDFFIFDLDPYDGQAFTSIKAIAFDLCNFLKTYGYHPFVKTSGGKGLHLFIPIEAKYDYQELFDTVKELATEFVKTSSQSCTLQIQKKARKKKLLLDIYRNRSSQTIIAPYSVRGRPNAPVSMPLTWEELEDLESPSVFHLRMMTDHIRTSGDAWEGFSSFAVPLHHDESPMKEGSIEVPESRYYKTPEQLQAYARKRDFDKTPEPSPSSIFTNGQAFVIHRHDASHLHYDLRLEQEGTLKSWAVPKGMPHKPGVKRLAIQTEPHPIEYLQFDGEIPKGQYGGGTMWIFARGRYEIIKEKRDGFYFHLSSPQLEGTYRIHNIKGKEWLLERVDQDLTKLLQDPPDVMLAELSRSVPAHQDDYFYEVKWDGIRASIAVEEGQIRIWSRNQRDLTSKFPELHDVAGSFRVSNGLFDGEIVCLDQYGRPEFRKVISRMHSTQAGKIDRATRTNPAYCYLFDCLYLDGRSLLHEPIERRRLWCKNSIRKGTPYRMSEAIDDGKALLEAAKQHELEGIMAKKKGSRYQPGKRSPDWLKIKFRQIEEVSIIGYTAGQDERKETFRALHMAEAVAKGWKYRGKVGTGFDDKKMQLIADILKKQQPIEKPITEKTADDATTTWLDGTITCRVEYASITQKGTYREPVFVELVEY